MSKIDAKVWRREVCHAGSSVSYVLAVEQAIPLLECAGEIDANSAKGYIPPHLSSWQAGKVSCGD